MKVSQKIKIRDETKIGQVLSRIRESRGITVTQIAQRTGLSRESIYRIERGENMTTASLFDYTQQIGVSIHFQIEDMRLFALEREREKKESYLRQVTHSPDGTRGR